MVKAEEMLVSGFLWGGGGYCLSRELVSLLVERHSVWLDYELRDPCIFLNKIDSHPACFFFLVASKRLKSMLMVFM